MDTSMVDDLAESVDSQLPAITFTKSGVQPDVSLQVFHQAFHVHSAVLKLKSAFFFKFLDSEDKALRPRPQGKFTYEWVTSIDDDGTWHLICSSAPASKVSENEHSGDPETEIEAVIILLSAFYGQKFTIDSIEQLDRIVKLADYYRALPTFSYALDGAFLRSPALIEAIHVLPHRLIKVAVQLRNEVLYRECLIQCMGPWSDPKWVLIEDDALAKIAIEASRRVSSIISRTQHDMLNLVGNLARAKHASLPHLRKLEQKFAEKCLSPDGMVLLPWFYRKLYESSGDLEPIILIKETIGPLLRNKLALNPKCEQSGEGKYEDYFLCLEIYDDDLPWNTEETDW